EIPARPPTEVCAMQPISQEALRKAQAGDETAIAALIARLMPLIRKSARQNLAPGLDLEDAVQEGLIGLFEALRRYDADRGAPFVPFAAACIRHAQQDARRAATRKKHAPLNDSVPLPEDEAAPDRKSTRLDSSHGSIAYAAFGVHKIVVSRLCIHRLNDDRPGGD